MPDGTVDAVVDVAVGVDARQVRVPLGSSQDLLEAGGLRNTPVVVLTVAALDPVVCAGAERAGRASVSRVRAEAELTLGASLLLAARTSEVLVIVGTSRTAATALVVARALGGRPLPVVPLDDSEAAAALLEDCWVDLDVALPSVDGTDRVSMRRAADALGLFSRHHVVEVDPRPAFREPSSPDAPHSSLTALAAAATGVLAGRIAAGNRRWR